MRDDVSALRHVTYDLITVQSMEVFAKTEYVIELLALALAIANWEHKQISSPQEMKKCGPFPVTAYDSALFISFPIRQKCSIVKLVNAKCKGLMQKLSCFLMQ